MRFGKRGAPLLQLGQLRLEMPALAMSERGRGRRRRGCRRLLRYSKDHLARVAALGQQFGFAGYGPPSYAPA